MPIFANEASFVAFAGLFTAGFGADCVADFGAGARDGAGARVGADVRAGAGAGARRGTFLFCSPFWLEIVVFMIFLLRSFVIFMS